MLQFLKTSKIDPYKSHILKLHMKDNEIIKSQYETQLVIKGQVLYLEAYINILWCGKLRQKKSGKTIIPTNLGIQQSSEYYCEQNSIIINLNENQVQQLRIQKNLILINTINNLQNMLQCKLTQPIHSNIFDFITFQDTEFVTKKQQTQNYIFFFFQGNINILQHFYLNSEKHQIYLQINCSKKYYILGSQKLFTNNYRYTVRSQGKSTALRIRVQLIRRLIQERDLQRIKVKLNKNYENLKEYKQRIQQIENGQKIKQRIRMRSVEYLEMSKIKKGQLRNKKLKRSEANIRIADKQQINIKSDENSIQIMKYMSDSILRRRLNGKRNDMCMSNGKDYLTPIKNRLKILKRLKKQQLYA